MMKELTIIFLKEYDFIYIQMLTIFKLVYLPSCCRFSIECMGVTLRFIYLFFYLLIYLYIQIIYLFSYFFLSHPYLYLFLILAFIIFRCFTNPDCIFLFIKIAICR